MDRQLRVADSPKLRAGRRQELELLVQPWARVTDGLEAPF